ncbi:MAG TPA: hypothetical protein VIJ90_08415 [Gemmatimonadaceae bacterium]
MNFVVCPHCPIPHRALSQAVFIVLLALVLGVRLRLDPVRLLGVATAIMLGAALFSTFMIRRDPCSRSC